MAVQVVRQLQRTRPNLKFVVVGPDASDIHHLFSDWLGGYVLTGWSEQPGYTQFDALLHPAKAEPYGMVISEAMGARVPVVISDMCGASTHVAGAAGAVLPLSAPISVWADTLDRQLSRTEPVPQFERSWCAVATEHERIWSTVVAEKLNPGTSSEPVGKGLSSRL